MIGTVASAEGITMLQSWSTAEWHSSLQVISIIFTIFDITKQEGVDKWNLQNLEEPESQPVK